MTSRPRSEAAEVHQHAWPSRIMPRRIVCCSLPLLTFSVVGSSVSAQWKGTFRDSAGITIVSNTTQGVWDSSNQWRVEEDLRIGVVEGDPNYQFGEIGWIAVGSDGRIFVLDRQGRHVKVFSQDGQYERTVGSPGGGPGEIGSGALFVLTGPGDTLLVPDIANRRVNVYAADGSVSGSFPLDVGRGLPMVWQATAHGTLASQVRPLNPPQSVSEVGQSRPRSMDAIVLFATDGSITDTVFEFPSGGTLNLGGRNPEIVLFSPEPIWHLADDMKVLYGMNNDYRISVHAAGGHVERVITMPADPRPVTDKDKSLVLQYLAEAWTDAGVPPTALPELRSLVRFGPSIPALASLRTGPGGTIWVQHARAASDLTDEELEGYDPINDAGAPEWDVFDAEGRFLGVVTMPARFTPRIFRSNRVYGVLRSELDVSFVVRLGIIGT